MRKLFLICGAVALLLSSCDDKNTPDDIEKPVASGKSEAYILTQGSYSDKIDGSFNVLDLESGAWQTDVFAKNNGRELGATPQCGVAYGGKIYLGMYESNTIEIIDRYTFKSVKQISLEGSEHGQEPRSMVAEKGKVYISMFDGKVARLDTLSQTIDASVKVGPNPEEMCLFNGKLYVPNSDGMNWADNYKNGTTVSVVSLQPFSNETTINVPLNPGVCVAARGNVYVLCKGNYFDIPSMVYRIESDGSTTSIKGGNMLYASGDNVYIIEANYDMSGNHYYIYDTLTKTIREQEVSGIDYPNSIGIDRKEERILITANVWNGGMPGYTLPTKLFVLDLDWKLVDWYELGVGESSIFFSAD